LFNIILNNFLLFQVHVSNTKLYGLVGWAKTTTSGTLRKTDVDGLAFGAGLDYTVAKNISLFADYERLFQKSDAPKLDAVRIRN
jgi:opacity protein-like surface antigen